MNCSSKTFCSYRQHFDSYREFIHFMAADMSLITDVSAAMNLTCTNVSQTTENNKHNCPLFYEHCT